MEKLINCLQCSKIVTAKRNWTVFCSNVCRVRFHKHNKPYCFYCGNKSQARDHVTPRSRLGSQNAFQRHETLPTCTECNSMLGDFVTCCAAGKAEYLLEKYLLKYKKYNSIDWSNNEKQELGYTLKTTISKFIQRKKELISRFLWIEYISTQHTCIVNTDKKVNNFNHIYHLLSGKSEDSKQKKNNQNISTEILNIYMKSSVEYIKNANFDGRIYINDFLKGKFDKEIYDLGFTDLQIAEKKCNFYTHLSIDQLIEVCNDLFSGKKNQLLIAKIRGITITHVKKIYFLLIEKKLPNYIFNKLTLPKELPTHSKLKPIRTLINQLKEKDQIMVVCEVSQIRK